MRYCLSDLLFESGRDLPELTPSTLAGVPEATIRWPAGDAPGAPVPFATWRTPDDEVWLAFGDLGDRVLLTFPGLARFAVTLAGTSVEVFPDAGTPASTVRHLLLNQVMPLVISRRGRLALHASAVSFGGHAAAFIGRSGTGKSTLAAQCALQGARIVCDDCLVLEPRTGGWFAVPCGAGLRLWPDSLGLLGRPGDAGDSMAHYTEKRRVSARETSFEFETAALPLTAIYRLDRDGAVGEEKLAGREAVMALAEELFRLDIRDASESRRQFDAIATLARDVALIRLPREAPADTARRVLCRM